MKFAPLFILFLFPVVCFSSCQESENPKENLEQDPNAPRVYSVGNTADIETETTFGIVMLGGAESDTEAEEAAFRYLVKQSGGGDFVVLRASGADGYNSYIYETLGGVNAVHTLVITSKEQAMHPVTLEHISQAEAIFIAGGDQSRYINFWKDSPLESAINEAVNLRKVPIGGTSAGLAILGGYFYGAQAGSALSADVLKNPYHPTMDGLDSGMLKMPFLGHVITDSHYSNRNRQGRHVAFMARLIADLGINSSDILGVGVDEATCILLDAQGIGKVVGQGYAYFLRAAGGAPEVCQKNQPLTWSQEKKAIECYILSGTTSGQQCYDFKTGVGTGGSRESWYVQEGLFYRKPQE